PAELVHVVADREAIERPLARVLAYERVDGEAFAWSLIARRKRRRQAAFALASEQRDLLIVGGLDDDQALGRRRAGVSVAKLSGRLERLPVADLRCREHLQWGERVALVLLLGVMSRSGMRLPRRPPRRWLVSRHRVLEEHEHHHAKRDECREHLPRPR